MEDVVPRLRRVGSGPRSIRRRLGWLLGAVSVGMLLAVNLAWLPGAIREVRDGQAELQRIAVRGARDQIQLFLEDKERALVAQAMLFRLPYLEGDPAELRLLGQRFLLQEQAFEEIGLLDAGGMERFRLSRTLALTDRDLGDRSGARVFREAIQRGVAWGEVVTAETSLPRVTLGVRLRRSERENVGVVFGVINLQSLWELTERTTLSHGGRAYVVDEGGRLIAADDPNLVLKRLSFADRSLVQRLILPAGPGPVSPTRGAYTNEHAARVVATGLPLPGPRWAVVLEQPQALLYAPILRKLWFALSLSLVGLAASVVLARLMSRRFTEPITQLREEVRQFGEGHLGRRVAIETSDEIGELATQFNQMADQLAASHRDLERKVAEKTRDLSALYAVTGPIGRANDLNAVIDEAAAKILAVTGADAASVRLLDATGTRITMATYRGFPDAYVQAQAPIGQFNRMGREVLQTGQPVIVADLVGDPVYGHGPLVRNGYRSAACLPLRTSGAPLGVMTLAARKPGQITPGQGELFVAIAHQIAVAIENARLFQGEQERRRQLEAVRAVAEEVTRELDLPTLLGLILRRATELVGAAAGTIHLWDEATQTLVAQASCGVEERMRETPLRLGQRVPGTVAQRRQGMIVNDYRTSPHADPFFLERTGTTAVLGEPLLYHDRLVGVITVRHEGRTFTEQDRETLALLAAQAAIAIENARLYEQTFIHAQTLEQRVRERTAELEKANQAKSEFLANMSHELRTPLNAIIGFAQMLRMPTFGPLTPKQERYVSNIQTSGVHLLNLVNDVLDLAKVEAGRLALHREATSVGAALAEAVEGIRPEADKKGLTVACDLEPDLPPVHADPVRLRQILMNLLSNAVKFTEPGGQVTVRAARAPGDQDAYVDLSVQDTGVGIAPEDLGRLFRKFEQLDGSLAKTHQGTGLGLALTRHLVDLHGGTIRAHSAGRGQGATFTVRLPIARQRQRPEVLVVDDDPQVRQVLTAAVGGWGWDAAAAATLAEARAAVDHAPPDLVILDSFLPDGSGLAFARDLRRELAPRAPILMYTGLGAEEGQMGLRAGADDYLVKPAPLEVLQRKATELLSRAGWPGLAHTPGARPSDPLMQDAGILPVSEPTA